MSPRHWRASTWPRPRSGSAPPSPSWLSCRRRCRPTRPKPTRCASPRFGWSWRPSAEVVRSMSEFELFHRLVDEGSARVRRFVTERELTEVVGFRNVSFAEHLERLKLLGGGSVPALWDGK